MAWKTPESQLCDGAIPAALDTADAGTPPVGVELVQDVGSRGPPARRPRPAGCRRALEAVDTAVCASRTAGVVDGWRAAPGWRCSGCSWPSTGCSARVDRLPRAAGQLTRRASGTGSAAGRARPRRRRAPARPRRRTAGPCPGRRAACPAGCGTRPRPSRSRSPSPCAPRRALPPSARPGWRRCETARPATRPRPGRRSAAAARADQTAGRPWSTPLAGRRRRCAALTAGSPPRRR